MADRDREAGLIGEFLQFELPQSQPIAVAAAGVGGDEDALRLRVDAAAFGPPPPRIKATAKAPGSWSVPMLTKPALRPMS